MALSGPALRGLRRLGLLAWAVLGVLGARAQTWSGVVVHVSDGDTVYVRAGDVPALAVRLLDLDAPEICQAGGEASRAALLGMVLHQSVTVVGSGRDIYGRELGRLFLQGQDVGRAMVAQGQAWAEGRGRDGGAYAQEQRQARMDRRGLFAQPSPEWPRAFRRRHGPCHPTP